MIGVGISEVGDDTEHFVEIDPMFKPYTSLLNIGLQTAYSSNHFRIPNEGPSPQSNSFRAWMSLELPLQYVLVMRANLVGIIQRQAHTVRIVLWQAHVLRPQ